MARLTSVKEIWTFILGYGGAIACLGVAPRVAARMLESHPATGGALLGVAIGTMAVVPTVLLILWMYRRSDEYERHGLLLVTSIAFCLAVIAITALDFLADTGLLRRWVWAPRWWTMVGCWMIAMLGVRAFRSRST